MHTRPTLVTLLVVAGSLVVPATQGVAAAATPMCHGHRATIVGHDPGRRHLITGTRHRDVIVGTDTRDLIRARGGNDLVCGGNGADDILGGPGDDRLYGGLDHTGYDPDRGASFARGDSINGGPGDDYIDLGYDPGQLGPPLGARNARDMVSYAGSAHGVHLDLETGRATGQGHDRIIDRSGYVWFQGSSHDDRVLGTSGDDLGILGPGNDVFRGREGNDILQEEFGAAPSGTDRVYGGPGDDVLWSVTGGDLLEGGPGDDRLYGWHAAHQPPGDLRGGPGDDLVSPSDSNGHASGGDGTDLLDVSFGTSATGEPAEVDLATGTLTGAGGVMRIGPFEEISLSSFGPLDVLGTDGPDQINYEAPGITAHLGGGDDLLTWQAAWAPGSRDDGSDDTVDGGPGNDTVDVGAGNDTCTNVEDGPC